MADGETLEDVLLAKPEEPPVQQLVVPPPVAVVVETLKAGSGGKRRDSAGRDKFGEKLPSEPTHCENSDAVMFGSGC